MQHPFATRSVSGPTMENLRQLPILAEYDSQSAYKLSDTIKNLGEDTETEHKRVEQIEGFIDETKATRAKRMEQANALKEALRHHEEAVIDLTSILTKQASMLNDVHLNIKDLEERKEAAMWLSNTKNPNKPFVKEKIESVREFLDLEAPEKVDMLTSLVAVATLYKLENYGIGNRSGVYKKVQTGKGNASTNELQLRIKRLLEFDVESFPVDRFAPRSPSQNTTDWSRIAINFLNTCVGWKKERRRNGTKEEG
jgi:chromosome segregation ATPase